MRRIRNVIREVIQTRVICDVPRTEKDVYRISRKAYRGLDYVDIRIFYRAIEDPEKLVQTITGVWIEKPFVSEVIEGLIKAKAIPKLENPRGKKFPGVCVAEYPVTEYDIYRVTKGYEAVQVRRFMKIRGGRWRPFYSKGIIILNDSLEDVIKSLKKSLK